MDRHTDPEARETKLIQLIEARTEAVSNEILFGRSTTTRAVAELCQGLNCDEDEAEALVRAAVIGREWLVGKRINEEVKNAIHAHATSLAKDDIKNIERRKAEQTQHERIEQRVWERFFASCAA